jgi:hypothetical protein
MNEYRVQPEEKCVTIAAEGETVVTLPDLSEAMGPITIKNFGSGIVTIKNVGQETITFDRRRIRHV